MVAPTRRDPETDGYDVEKQRIGYAAGPPQVIPGVKAEFVRSSRKRGAFGEWLIETAISIGDGNREPLLRAEAE